MTSGVENMIITITLVLWRNDITAHVTIMTRLQKATIAHVTTSINVSPPVVVTLVAMGIDTTTNVWSALSKVGTTGRSKQPDFQDT